MADSETIHCNARLKGQTEDRPEVEPGRWAGDGYCKRTVSSGRCKDHGGNGGRPPTHGLYSSRRDELREKLRQAGRLDNKGSLEAEIDVLRALLADFMERVGEPDRDDLDAATKLLKEIRRMVDTVHKQMTRERLTKDEEQRLLNTFATILRNHVPEDDRDEALDELEQALGASGERRALESGH